MVYMLYIFFPHIISFFCWYSLHGFQEIRLLAHNTLKVNSAMTVLLVLAGVELNFFTIQGHTNSVNNSGIVLFLLINAKAFYAFPTAPVVSRLGVHEELGGEIAGIADSNSI